MATSLPRFRVRLLLSWWLVGLRLRNDDVCVFLSSLYVLALDSVMPAEAIRSIFGNVEKLRDIHRYVSVVQ
jgi:hypothetical protein